MDARVKKLWVDALRSGKYRQGTNSMLERGHYCCLGVLSDLYCKDTGSKWPYIDNITATLHQKVCDWAKVESEPTLPDHRQLAEHNDGMGVDKKSFPEIADLIERNL